MYRSQFKNFSKTLYIFCIAIFSLLGCSEDSEVNEEITISAQNVSLTIDENPQNGSVLGRINGTTNRGQITYSLRSQSPEGAISINSNSGEITVANSLLFEFDDRMIIEALALLSNDDVQKEVDIIINLIEVQEAIIVSIDDLEINIDENPGLNDIIGTISGTTNRGQITYSITMQDPEGALSIDNNTGEISVVNPSLFDFEANPTLIATVQGQNEDVSDEAAVQINLIDVLETISFSKINTTGTIFSARTGMETVVFNDNLFLFGGFDGGIERDVWSTNNITSWNLRGSFGVPSTNGFQVEGTIYQDKIWMTSSGNGLTVPTEVWSSSDGEIWNQETATGEFFSGRSLHQMIVFNNKIWVIAGTIQGFDDNVWSSSDGINWNQETVIGADFTGLIGHQAVVFQEKLYIIGGRRSSVPNNDIWSSTDGINWTKETHEGNIFEARSLHQVLVFNNKMWLIGGFGDNPLGDVWSSTNGRNWNEEIIEGETFSSRYHHQCAVYNEKLYLIGGRDASSRLNDVWILND